MLATTLTTSPPAVIPLQRHQAHAPRRRHTADRSLPPTSDLTWYDGETAALFAGEHAVAHHGRRCACCRSVATAADVAS